MGAQDYNHSGQPGEKLPHYLYPENIYLAIYFCDMTEADGPTQVIPGECMLRKNNNAPLPPAGSRPFSAAFRPPPRASRIPGVKPEKTGRSMA